MSDRFTAGRGDGQGYEEVADERKNQNITLQSNVTQNSAEVDILKQQVDMLQKQLDLAQHREIFQREQLQAKDEQIESLQRLLGAPKKYQEVQDPAAKLQSTSMVEDAPIVKEPHPEPKRFGLFGRVIRAVLD